MSLHQLRILGVCALLVLVTFCLATELWLNPLRPGGSWLALKVLPLLGSLGGFLHGKRRSYQWMSLFVWLYFMEGAVRAASDPAPVWGGIEAVLAVALFAVSAAYSKISGPSKRPSR